MSDLRDLSSSGVDDQADERFMRAALQYGRRWLGETAPNPAVGAILVKDGVIVGRGATRPGGRPHAETQAIAEAGEAARGATLYVTLEPCSHHGKTPPCAEAVVAAGIARVVSALEDPDTRVAGRGHRLLTEAGVSVRIGVCEQQARRANLGHILRVTEGRPMTTLKLSETADGYVAGEEHDPRLRITGGAADGRVQIFRSMHDAIMVGAGTARADDPLLTVRAPGLEGRKPLRVVLDSRAALSLRSRLATTARDWPTLVVAARDASKSSEDGLAKMGVDVVRVERDPRGNLSLQAALRALAERGVMRVFCEGGPTLASQLTLDRLVDQFILFRAPKPLGRPGLPALSAAARRAIEDDAIYRKYAEGRAGADMWEKRERIA